MSKCQKIKTQRTKSKIQNSNQKQCPKLKTATKTIAKNQREAANVSTKANRRAKSAFHDTVNNTLRNPSISAKKKFNILFKLMKNNKFSNIPPLVENNVTVQDPSEQSNIFNTFFASKSTVQSPNDPVPNLHRKEGVPSLDVLNTSPLEVAKIIRNIKKSHLSHCGIPGKFIHLISTTISFSLSRLFNNLFEIGHFQMSGKLHT